MASNDSHALGLTTAERALLDLAADDRRDTVSLAPQEELLLQLYNNIQELELERAILEQDLEEPSTDDVEEQLAVAERELLEARATLTVRRKAIESILMTDPILKAVHLKAGSPAERALLLVVNRRDLTSLVYENLANARTATLKELTSAEVDNLQLLESNQALTTELLAVTAQETSWRDRISDDEVIQQVEAEEQEYRKVRAQRDTLKSVVSALVVGSGIDWARDEKLRDLVLDELD